METHFVFYDFLWIHLFIALYVIHTTIYSCICDGYSYSQLLAALYVMDTTNYRAINSLAVSITYVWQKIVCVFVPSKVGQT